jgi:DNA invertase Pin-like site-specific DNA recombinase
MSDNQKPAPYRYERRTGYSVNPEGAALIRRQVAIYARVGSQGQLQDQEAAIYARSATGENAALAGQVDQCKAYAAVHGYAIDDQHIYQEVNTASVNLLQHEQFTHLFEAAKRHEFTVLLVTHLDRLSRNSSVVMGVIRKLKELGIEVVEAHQ